MALKSHDSAADTKDEISSLAAKLKAKRALANPEEENRRLQEEAYRQEQARLKAERKQKEAEEKRKRDEARARLKERAALWN